MANKITKKEMFTMIMALDEVKANQDMVDFINHEIELLDKKATSKKATKVQTENIGIKDKIVEVLSNADKALTVTEIQSLDESLGALSNQKISALLRQLIDEGKVTKSVDKKKSVFSLV